MPAAPKKKSYSSPRKPSIPSGVRDDLWERYFGPETTIGTCFVCGRQLDKRDNYEVGHYISTAEDGTDDIENLRPVCRSCNRSMGKMSIPDFKRKYYPNVPDLGLYDPEKNPGIQTRVEQTQTIVSETRDMVAGMQAQLAQLAPFPDGILELPERNPLRQYFQSAEQFIREYKWAEAKTEIGKAFQLPTTPSQRAVLYNLLGSACYGPSDFAGAEAAWRDMIREAERIRDVREKQEAVAAATGNIGVVLGTKGDLDGALNSFKKALAIHEKLGRLEGQASALGNIGAVLRTKGDLEGALENHKKSLAISEKLGRLEAQAANLGNIGVVLKTRGDLDGALEYYQKALAINEKLGRLEGQAINLGNIGNVLRIKGDLEGALENCKKALAIAEKLGRLEWQAVNLGNIGVVLEIKGDLEGALEHYRRSLGIAEKLGSLEGQAINLGNIGVVLRIKGDLDGAREYYQRSIAIYEQMGAGNSPDAQTVRRNLAQLEGK